MNKEQTDKRLAIILACILIICYIGAIACHNIPSYVQDYLTGVVALLHWTFVIYVPLFPTLAFFITLYITAKNTIVSVCTLTFVLTLIFTIFAYCSDVLKYTWTFMSVGSFFLALAAHYDLRTSRSQKTQNSASNFSFKGTIRRADKT